MTTLQSNQATLSPPRQSAPQTPASQTPVPQTPTSPPDATEMLGLRRAAPLLLLLTVAAVFCLIGWRIGDRPAPHADVTLMPTAFGSWVMVGSEKTDPKHLALDDATAASLSLDSYTQRDYRDRVTGRDVQILLEYRRLGRGAFNHRPEACYPAAGYTLTGRTVTPVTYGGQPAAALTSVADRATQDSHGNPVRDHQVLLYWFGTGRQMENNFVRQQLRMALGRLQPDRNGWAFVRVISECQPGDEAATLTAEKDFVQQASPAIIQSISSPADAQ